MKKELIPEEKIKQLKNEAKPPKFTLSLAEEEVPKELFFLESIKPKETGRQ